MRDMTEKAQDKASLSARRGGVLIPLLARAFVYLALLAIPLTLIGHYRYLPFDDCMRHSAKAASGRAWADVLVLRPDVTLDQHPGWHAFLGAIHCVLDADPTFLVVLSYVVLFLLVVYSPMPAFQRPEAWVASLLLASLASPLSFLFRLTRGRPYLFSEACLLCLLFLWNAFQSSLGLCAITAALVALSVWIHGSWYLWALPVVAFFLAGSWRKGGCFFASVSVGIAFGALATGHPAAYLWQQLHHAILAFGSGINTQVLVGEFGPSSGCVEYLALAGLVLVFHRMLTGAWVRQGVEPAVLVLAGLGWLAGLLVFRFWNEWGLAAALFWIALQIEDILVVLAPNAAGRRRLALAAGLAVALLLAGAGDYGARWSDGRAVKPRAAGVPAAIIPGQGDSANWMPGPGGILYNSEMSVFNSLFFRNPQAQWKYAYGFEAGIMTPENLAVLRDVQSRRGVWAAYQPWIDRLRVSDRIAIVSILKPDIPALEWLELEPQLWIGRKP